MISIEYFKILDSYNYIGISLFAIVGFIAFIISRKAESFPFRVIFIYLAIEMLLKEYQGDLFFTDNIFVAIGFILPHIKYFFMYIVRMYLQIRMMFSSTYYFFITIYYKALKFFNWIKALLVSIKVLFETRSFKQASDEYEEDNPYKEKSKSYKYTHNNHFQEEKTYQKSFKKKEPKVEQQAKPKEEKVNDEFARYYSKDPYVVLGVSVNDSADEIKKIYRKLMREFHPDITTYDLEFALEISKLINNANEKLEKIHR